MNSKVIVLVSGGYNLEKAFGESLKSYNTLILDNNEYENFNSILKAFGWNGKRDKVYFDCLNKIRDAVNTSFDYDYNLLARNLTEFFKGSCDILIVKNYTDELAQAIEGYDIHDFQLLKINIVRENNKGFDDGKSDYTIVYDEKFEQKVTELFAKIFRSELLTTQLM